MDSRLLNLRLQAERRTVQPDHDLMLWAHDEIEMLRAALHDIRAAEGKMPDYEFVERAVMIVCRALQQKADTE